MQHMQVIVRRCQPVGQGAGAIRRIVVHHQCVDFRRVSPQPRQHILQVRDLVVGRDDDQHLPQGFTLRHENSFTP